MMRRREFITLIGGAAAWPLAARAQQPGMPVVGFLSVNSAAEWVPFVTAFRDGLKEAGYVESRNITVEYRWADGHIERLPAQAAEMVGRRVAVIVGGNLDASNCFYDRFRSCRYWACREPQPSGRQCHGGDRDGR